MSPIIDYIPQTSQSKILHSSPTSDFTQDTNTESLMSVNTNAGEIKMVDDMEDTQHKLFLRSPFSPIRKASIDHTKEVKSNSTSRDEENDKVFELRPEWLGTSVLLANPSKDVQLQGFLDQLIQYRHHLVQQLAVYPYDIELWLDLSDVDAKLGFTDIGAASAYRALLMAEAALNPNKITFPATLSTRVRKHMKLKLNTVSLFIIAEELNALLLASYCSVLYCLATTGAYWDGLLLIKIALKEFPKDVRLREINIILKEGFLEKHRASADYKDEDQKDLVVYTRITKIYQKIYPWMEPTLFLRRPGLVQHFNEELAALKSCLEVRPVIFGTSEEIAAKSERIVGENEDVGPLGLFATRDIKQNEIVMIDQFCASVSDISYDKMVYCDYCNAYLQPPFAVPQQNIRPKCCDSVVYCSQECFSRAKYHKLICGKDFSWLAKGWGNNNKGRATWRPVMFLRIVAIVLSDLKEGEHPLQHPLLARCAANYSRLDAETLEPEVSHEWQFFENVIAPARILSALGINIYKTKLWTQEVIQTIYWRIDNNANMSTIRLPGETEVNTIITISPNYLFFNHSCLPNVSWNGTVDTREDINRIRNSDGTIGKPGCSAVWCRAARDIKEGEELKISYVGNPLGEGEAGELKENRIVKRVWMEKWFSGGCGCEVCAKENKELEEEDTVE